MAAVNQHYVPQFLIRNFGWCINPSAKRKRRKYCVCAVKKGFAQPQQVSVKDLASEDYFYDLGESGGIEAQLAIAETAYAKTLGKIAVKQKIEKSQQIRISEFMALMSVRTKYIRDQLCEAGYHVARKSLEHARKQPLQYNRINETVRHKVKERTGKGVSREFVARQLGLHKNAMNEQVERFVDDLREKVENELNLYEIAKERQGEAVTKDRELARARFEGFVWRLRSLESSQLLLGDSGPLAFDQSKKQYVPVLFASKENIEHIVFPISPDLLLLGEMKQRKFEEIDIEVVNQSISALSQEFIAAPCRDVLDEYVISRLREKSAIWREYLPEEIR